MFSEESNPNIEIELSALEDIPALEQHWRDLEARSDASFFLSWLWISCWLAHLPERSRPHVLRVRQRGELVGLAILCPHKDRRFGLLSKRAWLLHETGCREFDRLTIEYNGFLVDRRVAETVSLACLNWLASNLTNWDELVLGGVAGPLEDAARWAATRARLPLTVRRADAAQGIDLARVRRSNQGYRAGLGRSTRSAVNRAIRLYQERGGLEFRVAESVDEALAFFDWLEHLHRAAWAARGRPSAFANPVFRPFHRQLIQAGVEAGAIRLCRTSVAGQPVGYLYNFVWRGRVLNYQSGFAYENDNRIKPGMVSHVLAIEDTSRRGILRFHGRQHRPQGAAGERPAPPDLDSAGSRQHGPARRGTHAGAPGAGGRPVALVPRSTPRPPRRQTQPAPQALRDAGGVPPASLARSLRTA